MICQIEHVKILNNYVLGLSLHSNCSSIVWKPRGLRTHLMDWDIPNNEHVLAKGHPSAQSIIQ